MTAGRTPPGASADRHRHGERPPWEIGRPQPAFLELAQAGAIRGRVLDVGCGTGEHALLAAALELDVTGVDRDPSALESARDKARARGLAAHFIIGDATRLADAVQGPFDTVLDCELFHALTGADRSAYLDALAEVLPPGGRYFMLGYSDAQPDVPHQLSRADILAAFGAGWQIDAIEATILDTAVHPDGVRGWLVAAIRTDREGARRGASRDRTGRRS